MGGASEQKSRDGLKQMTIVSVCDPPLGPQIAQAAKSAQYENADHLLTRRGIVNTAELLG